MLQTNVVGINVTARCNLNCKYCSLGVPRFKKANIPMDAEPESLEKSLHELFKVYDFIRHIDFTGGEVFIWDISTKGALADILKYCEKYKDKFGFGRILTNSTIVPSDRLLETICSLNYDFDFLLDNYGALSGKVGEIKKKLDFYGIKYREYEYFGNEQEFSGWVDMHNDSGYKNYSEEELRDIWLRCNLAHKSTARNLFNGIHYACCAALVLHQTSGLDYQEGYVSFMDENTSLEEKRRIIMGWNEKPTRYCEHCNGFEAQPLHQPRIPAAEQE